VPIPQIEATFFAEYLVEHLEQFQEELRFYMAATTFLTWKLLR
jgi:hypothetical protein